MSDFRIETQDERRGRYMRLARAASEAAAKSPLPGAKEMYLKLAQAWIAMADEDERRADFCFGGAYAPEPVRIPAGLNVKLNGMP